MCVAVATSKGLNSAPDTLADNDREAVVAAVEKFIEEWDEKLPRLYPVSDLNILLKEHWEILDQIWQIRDAETFDDEIFNEESSDPT